jgi:hypothetical protein
MGEVVKDVGEGLGGVCESGEFEEVALASGSSLAAKGAVAAPEVEVFLEMQLLVGFDSL